MTDQIADQSAIAAEDVNGAEDTPHFPLPGIAMTEAEYNALPETVNKVELIDGILYYPDGYEIVDGEVILSDPERIHQLTSSRFLILLAALVPDGDLYHAPTRVDFGERYKPQPDLMWVAANSSAIPARFGVKGAPDLIVEFLSPSTARHDKRRKFNLYERFGVREYWIVDPYDHMLEQWLHDGTRYQRGGVFFDNETFPSPVLGKDVNLTGVFVQPQP